MPVSHRPSPAKIHAEYLTLPRAGEFDPNQFNLRLSSPDRGSVNPDRAVSLEKYQRASYFVGG
jgi:hypothetical protein